MCEKLNNPQDTLRFVHIAGTNGKGSVLAYISSILRDAGYKVGCFSSPAVFDPMEIISVNGRNISKKDYEEGINRIEELYADEQTPEDIPSLFEMQTALAFEYFKNKSCDIVILECGMGGLTDATNIVKNTLAAVFTSISMDHMEYLGSSLHNIAIIKSGIIKKGALVYTSNTDNDILSALSETASDIENVVNIIREDKTLKKYIPLKGSHQLTNASLAVAVVKGLSIFDINVTEKNIINGLHNTRWPGRFELISKKPNIIIDGAHNPGAALKLSEALKSEYPDRRLIFVTGMYVDKDHEGVMEILAPMAYQILTVTTEGARTYDATALARDIMNYNQNVSAVGGIWEALDIAYLMAEPKDVIVVFGSLSFLSSVKKWYKEKSK